MVKYAIAFYSGGKDSHYAILKAMEAGVITKFILTVKPMKTDSWMFHSVNIKWVTLHAKAMGKPVIEITVSGVKDLELSELRKRLDRIISLLKEHEINYLISGAVASRYQKLRLDALAEELELKHYTPLWGSNQLSLLENELKSLGFILVAIQAYGFDFKLLGKPISVSDAVLFKRLYDELGISPVGEGGEFETFVIRSPLFKGKGIAINTARIELLPTQYSGYYIIEKASILYL